MGGPSYGGSSSSSSSGEEDGDAEWRAAIDSVATTSSFISSFTDGFPVPSNNSRTISRSTEETDSKHKRGVQQPKHYQIKAQKLLDDILEKSLEIVKRPNNIHNANADSGDGVAGGILLFKRAPPGIMFNQLDGPQGPKKRPRLLPGKEINEKSKKFKKQLKAVVVDGKAIVAAAKEAGRKALGRMEDGEAAAKASAKKEEERVAELKRVRGEKWLPSLAKEMKLQSQH